MASNVVKGVVDQLQQYGETRRGWLGVRIQDVTEDMADAMGLASASGALVSDVPEGPAMDAGMFDHPATQDNLAKLRERGVVIAGPASGRLASGLMGMGRLLETPELLGRGAKL